jgi:hypothetical protein
MKLKSACVVDDLFSKPYCRFSILSIIDFISQSAMNRSHILAKGPFIIYDWGWAGKKRGWIIRYFLPKSGGGAPKNIGSEGGSSNLLL